MGKGKTRKRNGGRGKKRVKRGNRDKTRKKSVRIGTNITNYKLATLLAKNNLGMSESCINTVILKQEEYYFKRNNDQNRILPTMRNEIDQVVSNLCLLLNFLIS